MTPLEAIGPAISEVRRHLELVQPTQWDNPTPCEGWSIRALAEHLIAGSRMTAVLLGGGSREDATACFTQHVGTNAPQAFADAAGIEKPAFERADLDMIVPHPARDLAVSELLGFRLGDYLIHTWDLAQALGINTELRPEIVELVWNRLEPMGSMLSQTGMFGTGPSGTVDDGSPLQDRLIDLTGRRLGPVTGSSAPMAPSGRKP